MEGPEIVQVVTQCYVAALPLAVIFWTGELIVTTFLRAAFGGRLSYRLD